MAATCSHILTNVSQHSEPRVPSHSRDLSTVSSTTLHTNTTVHSQPTEPLLRPTTPKAGQYCDIASHQSTNTERSPGLPQWSQSHAINLNHSAAIASEKAFRNPLKRVKILRRIKNALIILMAFWAVFCTVRYLVAFCIYGSTTGQALSLALAAITGLSFALICCATILGFVQPHLLIHGFPVQSLLTMRSVLQYSASCCLLGPSIVNFVLIFVWKKTTDLELQTRHRCRLDIDLVWSPPFSLCNHKTRTWGLWLALSAIRLVVTLIIIITFHFIASSTQLTFVKRTKSRQSRHKKGHNRLESCLTPLIPGNGRSKSSVVVPNLGRDSSLPRQSSDSTLSAKTSPRNRLRPNRSRLSAFTDDIQTEVPNDNNPDFLPMNSDHTEPEGELNSFVHRFRSLITQITRETEEGIAFACSDDSNSSHRAVDSLPSNESPELGTPTAYQSNHQEDYDPEDDFYTSSAIQTHASYEKYQPYPAEEEIRMLNGFIRRMPTIESMGSHELGSSMGLNWDRRPPTRNTLGSWAGTDFSGSESHSQRNSLTAQAEVLAGTYHSTEIGELIRRGDTIRKVDNPSTNADNSGSLGASTKSSSALSYLTAPESITKSLVIPSSDSDGPSNVPLPKYPNLKENGRRPDDAVDMNP